MDITADQLKAAYALNLCMVSVSQIIDYEDSNIMEQEYEAILNNLNLEQMPKDEALLKILKQILDTITFFRIAEGDKKFIEKEYEQKMKNAIWAAVPRIGMVVAGGSAVTMAVSLASQVGIGYMNYRRAKADGLLEKEKQYWQLQRSAIEQFNCLRRELFDTAWRLSAEYHFPDQLRLTERQIKQYNHILMDQDLIRKYERLDAIKDAFLAYPPFWYQIGNTANALSRSEYSLSTETRAYYQNQARNHFQQYRASNQQGLLREDPISSACALELVDLLDSQKDHMLIEELLDEAIRFSGRQNDILQLAAMEYLKLNQTDKASVLLSQLVNEQFNTTLNAQLLSSIYVADYGKKHLPEARVKYNVLLNRLGETTLYPMPRTMWETPEETERYFQHQQRDVLQVKYDLVLQAFAKKYEVRFGRLIPVPIPNKRYPESYFMADDEAIQRRKYEMSQALTNRKRAGEYLYRLQDAEISFQLINLLNDLYDETCLLDLVSESVREDLTDAVELAVLDNRKVLNELQAKLDNGAFEPTDMERLTDLHFHIFTKDYFDDLESAVEKYVLARMEMQDFALSEQDLIDFCNQVGIPDPEALYERNQIEHMVQKEDENKRFDLRLLRGTNQTLKNSDVNAMNRLIRESVDSIVLDRSLAEFYTEEDSRTDRYLNHNPRLQKNDKLKSQILAVLDDKMQKGDYDLLFTVYGVIPVKNGVVKNTVAYQDIHWDEEKPGVLVIDGNFSNKALDLAKLFKLVQGLVKYAKPIPADYTSKNRMLDKKFPFGNR